VKASVDNSSQNHSTLGFD